MRHIVIMPAHNESAYIGDTLNSLLAQTEPPDRIIVVDDGSDDGTADIVRRVAAEDTRVELISESVPQGRRYRVVEVFNRGYEAAAATPSQYVSKLDADQIFPPTYFERLLGMMDRDPTIAAASGILEENIDGRLTPFRTPENHVVGSLKTYRRDVFDRMGGFIPILGWDIVDLVKARSLGYRTATISDLRVLHCRRHASSGGIVKGNFRMGRGAYVIGSHPLFMLGRAVYRMLEPPYLVLGFALLAGYIAAWIERAPRLHDEAVVRHLRREQLQRLLNLNRLAH